MRRFTFIFLGLALVALLAYSFKPVTDVNDNECVIITGKIIALDHQDNNTIKVRLENDSHYYYIDNDTDKGLNLEELNSEILNKTVTLYCPNKWTLANPDGIVPHISRLEKGTRIVFSEF